MFRPPLALVVLALASLALPATAAASDYVPGEVIVHYEDGTSAHAEASVADSTGTVTEQAIPGGSDQLRQPRVPSSPYSHRPPVTPTSG